MLGSSLKFSRNYSRRDSEFSIISPYSPMIHIIALLASGSSKWWRFSHKSYKIPSYFLGYFLKISLITIIVY